LYTTFFISLIAAAILTCAGSWWIDKLYSNNSELTFPQNISNRARLRRPILFFALSAFIFKILSSTTAPENFFLTAAIFLLMLMTFTDFEQYMIFDVMTLPFAIIGAIYSWQMHLNFLDQIIAALIGGGAFLLLAIISKGALGGGDIKLIAALGLWFGCEKLLSLVLIGAIAGGLAAILLLIINKKNRTSYFAYGPYFTLAAIYFLLLK